MKSSYLEQELKYGHATVAALTSILHQMKIGQMKIYFNIKPFSNLHEFGERFKLILTIARVNWKRFFLIYN